MHHHHTSKSHVSALERTHQLETVSTNEINVRDFYDTDEDYEAWAKDPAAYIANQMREIELGAERLERSRADSARSDSGRRRKTVRGKEIPHVGGKADGVEVRDFAYPEKKKGSGLEMKDYMPTS